MVMREKLATGVAVLLGLFVLYTAGAGPFESLQQRGIFLALTLILGFLSYPLAVATRWRAAAAVFDVALCALSVAACLYVVINYQRIMGELPYATTLDKALTAALVIAILEIGRRAVGLIFPILILVGLSYALFGQHLPGRFAHRGFDVNFVTETLLLGDLGVWGMLLGVAATVIAAFVLFGSMLLHTGGGEGFMDLSLRLGGRSPGGAAKVATISSGLFGMVSGSAVANVATTGNFTIPMMKRLGYPASFAAAVEAVASTGGQIAPPIMGAAAFIMAEIVGVSYLTIMKAAVLPALVFYLSAFITIHLVAVRRGFRLVPDDEMPGWAAVLHPRKLLPVVAAVGALMTAIFAGRSVTTSAFWGIVALILVFVLSNGMRLGVRGIAQKLLDGLQDAGRGLVIIGVLLAGAQILVSMINLTGVGVTLSSAIVSVAGDNLIMVSVIVAVVCLIMGMGLPTTAAYVLVAAALVPAMVQGGATTLSAHMFVFYFATLSVITPPVCVAVFVASGIAQTNWLPAAIQAVRLAAVIYAVPFMILIYPGMVGQGSWLDFIDAALSSAVLVCAVPALLSAFPMTGKRPLDIALYLLAIALALWTFSVAPFIAAAVLLVAYVGGRRARMRVTI